jgi:hypothetical protein
MKYFPPSHLSAGLAAVRNNNILLPTAMFLVGMALFFKVDHIPGDLLDARFNMYVLEHGYRWLVRLDSSFWSAPFFYPAQNVIAYSDNHLGSLFLYAMFRVFGASRETGFQLWAIAIFALNYFVTYLVLRKQRLESVGATAGAYLFTFPMIMAAQIVHIQLAPRFMLPVAFWMACSFVETGSVKSFMLLLAACAYQIYLGIYIGYFLIISLGLFITVLFLGRQQWMAIRSFVTARGDGVFCRRILAYAAAGTGFILVLFPLILPYSHAESEFRRTWSEIAPLLPRWESYLYAAPQSILWGRLLHLGDSLPLYWEHRLFLGLVPLTGLTIFLYLLLKKKTVPPDWYYGLAMLGVVVGIAVISFCWHGFSLYYYVWRYLPGAGGIRAITRISLILIYPVAFIVGSIATCFMNHRRVARPSWATNIFGISILALLAMDQATGVASVSIRQCQRRVATLKAKIDRPKGSILWINDTNNDISLFRQLDAMLVAQDLGLNVVNGYSGLVPQDYPDSLSTLDGDICTGIGVWASLHPGAITNENLSQIGNTCRLPDCHIRLPVPIKGFSLLDPGDQAGNNIRVCATDRSAELRIPDMPPGQSAELLSFDLSTLNACTVKITAPNRQQQIVSLIPGEVRHVDLRIPATKRKCVVKFETNPEGVKSSNGDFRTVSFYLFDPHLARTDAGKDPSR